MVKYTAGCNKQNLSKSIDKSKKKIGDRVYGNYMQNSCSQWFVYRSVVIRIGDQRGLPTGNEKILLPAGNNVRTHGNSSLQQINRTVYTYIFIHL